jgi:hypothetical protein
LASARFGCDALFNLDHVPDPGPVSTERPDSGAIPDAACAPSRSVTTSIMGARTGGTGQASMADTFLVSKNQGQNYGAAPTLALCNGCSASDTPWNDSTALALIHFDMAAICPGSTVLSAELQLDTTDDNLGSGTVGVFVMLEAWDEGNGTASGSSGAASWNDRLPGTAWSNDGAGAPASRESTPIATFQPLDKNVEYSIPLPVAVVQKWLTAPETNFGFALVITSGNSDVQFHSRESIYVNKRPGFVVTSQAP